MIVNEYQTASGVSIRFCNSAYAGKTEEEKERLRQQVNETVSIIAARQPYEKGAKAKRTGGKRTRKQD